MKAHRAERAVRHARPDRSPGIGSPVLTDRNLAAAQVMPYVRWSRFSFGRTWTGFGFVSPPNRCACLIQNRFLAFRICAPCRRLNSPRKRTGFFHTPQPRCTGLLRACRIGRIRPCFHLLRQFKAAHARPPSVLSCLPFFASASTANCPEGAKAFCRRDLPFWRRD